jgi:hypothetical protein
MGGIGGIGDVSVPIDIEILCLRLIAINDGASPVMYDPSS